MKPFPIVALVAFVAGLLVGDLVDDARAGERDGVYRALDLWIEVYDRVRSDYVDPVDEEALVRGAVAGMVRSLDPHSEYLAADQVRHFREDTRGRFAGVGMEVALHDGVLTVLAAVPDTPAARAGVRAGDQVVAVDGESTRALRIADAVRRIRGPAGTFVELSLRRDDALREVRLKRAEVEVVAVHGDLLPDRVAHVRVRTFQRGTDDAIESEIGRLAAEAGGPLAGVLLDLRDNPGGLLSQGAAVADLFLDAGEIVRTSGRGHAQRYEASASGTFDLPLAVLVNEGSASAAEIVAGALQAHGRARLVGGKTFGKGTVQQLYELSDGSGVKLTIARYFTPDGRAIDGDGLRPDIAVASVEATAARPLNDPIVLAGLEALR